jgi:hypothetical protein
MGVKFKLPTSIDAGSTAITAGEPTAATKASTSGDFFDCSIITPSIISVANAQSSLFAGASVKLQHNDLALQNNYT